MVAERKLRIGLPGQEPSRWRWLALAGGFVVAAWLAYEYGQAQGGHNRFESLRRLAEHSAQVGRLQKENRELQERIAVLETGEQINREAYRRVEAELTRLQARLQAQAEDLAFYQGLVSGSAGTGALRVQDLVIFPGAAPTAFTVALVLAQPQGLKQRVTGSVDLQIEGVMSGARKTIGLAEATSEGSGASLRYSFRYFQNLQADLQLPEGFAPLRVLVKLTPKGSNGATVEQSFDWRVRSG
jgi:TolA-binding protein